jgi:BASS family bile acid:Na+ symporter
MSSVAGIIVAVLAWLGRQGTRAVAALLFIGLMLPAVDAVLKPYVGEAIFALLCIAFIRVEPDVLGGQLKRPGVVVAATLWSMLVIPSLFGAACLLTGVDRSAPDLYLGLMLQAMASPMMSAPVFAALMGLDATLVLVTMVVSTALTAATAPLFAWLFVGPALSLSPAALGLRLLLILAGALAVAVILRRLVGPAAIRRWKEPIDGINVLILYIFVGAVMENVGTRVITETWRMAGLVVLAFATVLVVLALTAAAFARAGASRAFALGLMASQRNMGLMVAATSRDLPDLVWLYFAFCQFPIYLLPQLLKPLARRMKRADDMANAAPGA